MGGAIVKTIRGRAVVLARSSRTAVVAFDARCTHQGAIVDVQGSRLGCPRHGSVFGAFNGEVLNGPAQTALQRIDVEVDKVGVRLR